MHLVIVNLSHLINVHLDFNERVVICTKQSTHKPNLSAVTNLTFVGLLQLLMCMVAPKFMLNDCLNAS